MPKIEVENGLFYDRGFILSSFFAAERALQAYYDSPLGRERVAAEVLYKQPNHQTILHETVDAHINRLSNTVLGHPKKWSQHQRDEYKKEADLYDLCLRHR